MKKITIDFRKINSAVFIVCTLFFIGTIKAQEKSGEDLRSKIEAQRVAFFTQQMNITPVEAQKFWPVYNEYLEKKNNLGTEKRKITSFYLQNSTTMNENDVDLTINKYVQNIKSETDLFEEYNKRFRKILSAQKVMKLYVAEIQFKTWLLGKIREKSNKLMEDVPN